MDFRRELMEARGYGIYEQLDPALLPNMYVAFRTSLSEGTEVFHSHVRERWRAGDREVLSAMEQWAAYAEEGRTALAARDYAALGQLMDANFDLRAKLYGISDGNLQMIQTARRVGATANFAGSGGAIVGAYQDERMYQALTEAMRTIGVAVVKPQVTP
jgi:glucuronokinase